MLAKLSNLIGNQMYVSVFLYSRRKISIRKRRSWLCTRKQENFCNKNFNAKLFFCNRWIFLWIFALILKLWYQIELLTWKICLIAAERINLR